MSYIETFTGLKFDVEAITPESLDIRDIGHALANKCRFGGHCAEFYSVAQHCIEGSRYIDDRAEALTFLLHDCGEAYLPDICRPQKHLFPLAVEAEREILTVASVKFGFIYPFPEIIKRIDLKMLTVEARTLMPSRGKGWITDTGDEALIHGIMNPRRAEIEFLKMFRRLGGLSK